MSLRASETVKIEGKSACHGVAQKWRRSDATLSDGASKRGGASLHIARSKTSELQRFIGAQPPEFEGGASGAGRKWHRSCERVRPCAVEGYIYLPKLCLGYVYNDPREVRL